MRRNFRLIFLQETKLVRNILSKPKSFSSNANRKSGSIDHRFRPIIIGPKSIWFTSDRKLASGILKRSYFDSCKIESGCVSVKGRNKNNEDRFNVIDLKRGVMYYGVFDGHRGEFASGFVNGALHGILLKEMQLIDMVDSDDYEIHGKRLLEAAFDKCQLALKKAIHEQDFDSKTKESVGSTALIALIINNSKLLVSHVGDSRAVLCKSGKPICLTDDHTPDNEEETNRILQSGGWIDWDTKMIPYVNGLLSMTRSFGNLGLAKTGVTHNPFIFQSDLDDETDQFLILCSDGISNWINDNDMVFIVSQYQDPNEAAHALISCARQYGSNDDATAIVIRLGGWQDVNNLPSESASHLLRTNVSRRY